MMIHALSCIHTRQAAHVIVLCRQVNLRILAVPDHTDKRAGLHKLHFYQQTRLYSKCNISILNLSFKAYNL